MELEGLITPTDLHYTVQHFAVPPVIETTDWGLRVFGEVKNSLTLNFDQLRRFPARTVRTQGLESLGIRRPYGALTTGKSLVVPSCGGKYHAPSIPIDLHWDSNRVPP